MILFGVLPCPSREAGKSAGKTGTQVKDKRVQTLWVFTEGKRFKETPLWEGRPGIAPRSPSGAYTLRRQF